MLGILAVVIGLLLGACAGGTWHGISTGSFRFGAPMLILFVVQGLARGRLIGMARGTHLGFWVWVCSTIALCALLALEWRNPGMALASLGMLLNLDVVLANGAMPIVSSAVTWPTTGVARALQDSVGFYESATPATLARPLADAIPLRIAGGTTLISVGDITLAVGVVVIIVYMMVGTEHGRRLLAPRASKESSG